MKVMLFFAAMLLSAAILYGQEAADLKSAIDSKDFEKAVQMIPQVIAKNQKDALVHIMAGDVYLEMEKYTEAAQMFEKAVDLDKKNVDSWLKYGRSLAMSGKRKEALELLKDAQDRFERNVHVLLEMANVYLTKESLTSEDLTKAELLITQAREMDKSEPDAFVALGDYYFKQRVYELAKSNYDEALKLNPNLLTARERLAISLYWLGNNETDQELSTQYYTRSLEEWNKLTQQDPKNARAFFEQGKILFLSNNFKDAVITLRNYVNLRPSGSLGRWFLAQSLDKIGVFDTAAYHLEIVAREIDSVRKKASLMRARALYDKADQLNKKNTFSAESYKDVINAYQQVMKDTVILVYDYQKIGQSYILIKDTVNALATWEESVKIDPKENCRIMDQIGYIYQRQAKYQQAIDILGKRASIGECSGSNDHIVYYLIGQSYLMSNRADSSLTYLEKSIKVDTNFMFSRISLGDAYASLTKQVEAEAAYNEVIEIGKRDTTKNAFVMLQAFSKLGQMFLDQKKFNDVLKVGERWAAIFPNEPYAYLFQAIAYHNKQDGKNACINYRKVLKIDPKNATATKNLKILTDNNQCGE